MTLYKALKVTNRMKNIYRISLFVMLYFFARSSHQGRIGRFAGVAMLSVYIAYNGLLAYQSMSGMSA